MRLEDMDTKALEAELARRRDAARTIDAEHEARAYAAEVSPVGRWVVTTEGDCEGKSTRDLGTYEGHVADIAAMLAGQAMYALKFAPVKVTAIVPGAGPVRVSVALPQAPGIRALRREEQGPFVLAWLRSAPTANHDPTAATGEGNWAATVTLVRKVTP